jgi:hypothetical protein
MPKRSSTDLNQTAYNIVQQSTGHVVPKIQRKPISIFNFQTNPSPIIAPQHEKNQAAVMLGRLGGLKGGKARAKALSKSELSKIAKNAAKARWKKSKRKS